MRKFLAILCTLITLYVLKETINIFSTDAPEIAHQRSIWIVISLSIFIPLLILSLWLWSPGVKRKKED